MKYWYSLSAALLFSVFFALPAAARVNMLDPWAPGLDFLIPKDTWNHDVHVRMGSGMKNTDFSEAGYLLDTPLSPDWEVGGGLNLLSTNSTGKHESGLGDLGLGAKYKLPLGYLPPSLDLCGEAGLTLPTGNPKKGLGAGGLGLFGGGDFQGALADNVTGYSHLGLRVFTKGQDTLLGPVFEYMFGIKYLVDTEWIATTDVRAFNHGRDEYKGVKGKSYDEIYLAPGAYYRPKGVFAEFQGALLLGLTGDSYDFGLQLSAKF
jgi:hypothetical protein